MAPSIGQRDCLIFYPAAVSLSALG